MKALFIAKGAVTSYESFYHLFKVQSLVMKVLCIVNVTVTRYDSLMLKVHSQVMKVLCIIKGTVTC